MDFGYVGDKFTWRGKRSGGLVLERLDRVLVTNSRVTENPATRVQHLHVNSSNHNLIILKLVGIEPLRNKTFCLEQMWMKERGCGETVKEAWGILSPGISAPIVSKNIK